MIMENQLKPYIKLLKDKKATFQDYKDIEKFLKNIQIIDVFDLFNSLLHQGENVESILNYVDPFINVIDSHLKDKELELPETGILSTFDQENKALIVKLNLIQDYFKENAIEKMDHAFIKQKLKELEPFNMHYTKTQNLLFPSLEKIDSRFEGLRILWGMQDACRRALSATLTALDATPFDSKIFSFSLGDYFFKAFGLIQKENRFLLQASLQFLTKETLENLEYQMFDYPFIFIEEPTKPTFKETQSIDFSGFIKTETGELNFEQLDSLLNSLPLDITFIDEYNKVRFFNKTNDRLFPRSSAIIGRDVRNCHPASSVHVVNQIIEAFRSQKEDEAKFWIKMKNHFVFIRYIAIRNKNAEYKGCLEVTQLVEDIRALEGERRLLEWD